jgi:RNA polymerase sigma-70 factor, ECF subfamily
MADGGSFDEFYAGAVGRLVGQLFPVTGDLHEAEEVVQEAFTRAAARWSRLRDYDVPEAWVRRVAMNLVTDRARSLRRQARAMLKLRPPPEVPPASVEALALAEALHTLPVRQRQVLVLHYLVDLSVEEVAHTLGMPDGTVKACCLAAATRWRPGLARPRRCLTPHERPAGTTSRAGRSGGPPRPHPRPRGGAAPRQPAAAAAGRRHRHAGRPRHGGRSGRD